LSEAPSISGSRGPRRPTINDVAALSGVSKATVSNVIRGTGSVSERTRERVQQAIATLGYRPNAAARTLVRRRTNVIGLIVGDFANAFNAELVERVEQEASSREYTTLVCTTGKHPEFEAARLETLLEQRVDGIALLQFSGDRTLMSKLLTERVPVVGVSCWDDYIDCVAVDDYAGIALAVDHLVALGHRRIGYLTDELIESTTRLVRLDACERVLGMHGLELPRELVLGGDDPTRPGPGRSPVEGLFSRADAPTAIVATNDNVAIALIDELESLGLSVPDDVSVVGFDGSAVAGLARVGLTTVAQPAQELASDGLDLLLQRIDGGPDEAIRQRRLEPALIERRSTAPPKIPTK
jgi:DNA-binding LacI/PurR family transcriptional regulator